MQAQKGFESLSMIQSFSKVLKSQGVKGLYRGCIPPLWGSGIYRSVQFSAFEATYNETFRYALKNIISITDIKYFKDIRLWITDLEGPKSH